MERSAADPPEIEITPTPAPEETDDEPAPLVEAVEVVDKRRVVDEADPVTLASRPPSVAAAPAGRMRRVQGVTTARFGETWYGFIHWISADARLVALRRYTREPRVSHHGEAGRAGTLEFIDTTTGQRESGGDLVATDPRGRWLVVRRDPHLWLIDSETAAREDLAALGADLEDDGNGCLPPRQATFDSTGTHVLFVRRGPDRLVIRALEGGAEVEVASGPGRLWRILSEGPDDRPLLLVVPRDSDGDGEIRLPRQRTTCVCRWCGRFAMMTSTRGWALDDFSMVGVDVAGGRVEIPEVWVPLGPDTFAEARGGALFRADGSSSPTPATCTQAQVVPGASSVILRCRVDDVVLWPTTGKEVHLVGGARPLAGARAHLVGGRRVVGVTTEIRGAQHLAVLDLDLGALAPGPRVQEIGDVDRRGRVLARDAAGLVAMDTTSGAVRRLASRRVELNKPNVVHIGDRDHAVDAQRGLLHALADEPVAVAENGCALLRDGATSTLDIGPWTLQCPGPKAVP